MFGANYAEADVDADGDASDDDDDSISAVLELPYSILDVVQYILYVVYL